MHGLAHIRFPALVLVHYVLHSESATAPQLAAGDKELLDGLVGALKAGNRTPLVQLERSVERDFTDIERDLEPILASLPRTEDGRFASTAVRYALHRLFIRRNGWSVTGLDPKGQAWNSTWTSEVALLAGAPPQVAALVREGVEDRGLDADGVALLAVLLQHLAREKAAVHLRDVMVALKLKPARSWPHLVAERVLLLHVASELLARWPATTRHSEWLFEVRNVQETYPNWPTLANAVRQRLEMAAPQVGTKWDFASLAEVAGDVGERWGRWGKDECGQIKQELTSLEDHGSGRVRLANFYGKALHEGKWQLTESEDYLRKLGALDESSPGNPRVIIPNYVGALNNCIAASDTMAVCCISECEELMHSLENQLRAPEAPPAKLVELIQRLPSSTVPAQKELSAVMLNRLNRIAAENRGMVPLHGRLFAQWLHHVYPRECPYPHLAGETLPLAMEHFSEKTGLNISASTDQMQALAGKTPQARKPPRLVENTPWSHQEELFIPLGQRPDYWELLHATVFAAALAVGALGYTLLRLARSARRTVTQAMESQPGKLYPV